MDYRVSNPVCSPCLTSLSVSFDYGKLLLPLRVLIDIRRISPLIKSATILTTNSSKIFEEVFARLLPDFLLQHIKRPTDPLRQ